MQGDLTDLPDLLPHPADDGAADHLLGMPMPTLSLPSTAGRVIPVERVPTGFERLVLYLYPMTGLPGIELPTRWNELPGARGCTPEACGFRDHAADLAVQGASVVGASTQSSAYQQEAAERLGLRFPLLSDAKLELADALRVPTFNVELPPDYDGGGERRLLKRLTLVIREGVIEHVFYPVFPPQSHAEEVLAWLQAVRRPVG